MNTGTEPWLLRNPNWSLAGFLVVIHTHFLFPLGGAEKRDKILVSEVQELQCGWVFTSVIPLSHLFYILKRKILSVKKLILIVNLNNMYILLGITPTIGLLSFLKLFFQLYMECGLRDL